MSWLKAAFAITASRNAYILFKRSHVFFTDTYLVFNGTLDDLNRVMQKQQASLVTNERGDHDQLDDTPLQTFCDKSCYRIAMSKAYANVCGATPEIIPIVSKCPDEYGNFCASHWDVFYFATHADLLSAVDKIPTEYHYYNSYTITNL